jgi:tetratricopeptide (TPR) repeat protein
MLTCPACGRANPVEASFCMGCGGPLGATATAHEVRKTVTALFCDAGYVAWLERGPEAGQPLFARAHGYVKGSGVLITSDLSGVPLARALLELGREGEADPVLDDLRENRAVIEPQIQARTMCAVVAARRGDLDEALRLSEEAEALAVPTDCLIDQADVALDRAEILLLAGPPDEARASAEDALEKFERKEFAIGIRRARESLAALDADAWALVREQRPHRT